MSQQRKRPATGRAPRTRIEDLPDPGTTLVEEDASVVVGGVPGWMGVRFEASREANSCTGGSFLGIPTTDSDYGSD